MCFSCIPKEAAAEIIGQFGGVQDLLSAMRAFPNSKAIASNCCGALWSLAVSGMARLRVVSKSLISGENDRAGGIHASSPGRVSRILRTSSERSEYFARSVILHRNLRHFFLCTNLTLSVFE